MATPTSQLAMGQQPNRTPSEHHNPTKVGSKMGGEFTYPKTAPLVLTHSQLTCWSSVGNEGMNPINHPFWYIPSLASFSLAE